MQVERPIWKGILITLPVALLLYAGAIQLVFGAAPPVNLRLLWPSFIEMFYGSALDPSRWIVLEYAQEQTVFQASNIAVSDGMLRLKADISANGYTSGGVGSWHVQSYGRWVARIRMPPAGMGYWPAFWMIPSTYPASMDNLQTVLIAEWFGAWPNYMTVAYAENDGTPHYQIPYPQGDFAGQWHTYEAELRPTFCSVKIDGVQVFRWDGNVPDIPMRIILGFAITSTYPAGPPDGGTGFPAYFDVDYVMVYP